ncbi:MAG: tryptophan halogenase [Lysobacterales bacterium]|jgi:tryptophan halogenase
MNDTAVERIIIVGGGVTGWVAAASIAHAMRRPGIQISVLASADEREHGALASLPIQRAFNLGMDIDEQDLMRETGASFSLGTQFRDWTFPKRNYFQPMGAHGASIEFVQFHNYAVKARQAGDETPFNTYSMCAAAARQGKFEHPNSDLNSILSTLIYAHHLDANQYATFMRRHAEANGVKCLTGRLTDVTVREADGMIESLTLEGGDKLVADLFIDCSGQCSSLLGEALQTPYVDWAEWLPANRILSGSSPAGTTPPCATITALDAGWHQAIGLQHYQAHRLVFNDQHLDDDSALDLLQKATGHTLDDERHFQNFRCGHREKFWSGNCIALGAAAGCFDPMDGTFLALLQSGLMRLINLFPDKTCNKLLADEYNEVTRSEYTNVRDFLMLHYRASERKGSPFWNDYLGPAVPESLAHKIRLFKARGQVAFYEEESFPNTSWVSVWLGQDQWPETYDPILDNYDFERLKGRFDQMKQIIEQAAVNMQTHEEYLARYCASMPPSVA